LAIFEETRFSYSPPAPGFFHLAPINISDSHSKGLLPDLSDADWKTDFSLFSPAENPFSLEGEFFAYKSLKASEQLPSLSEQSLVHEKGPHRSDPPLTARQGQAIAHSI